MRVTAPQVFLGASLLVAPAVARGQVPFPVTTEDSIAVAVAGFQTAIVHGQLTAHGQAIPQVLCLALMRSPPPTLWKDRLVDPDSIVMALVRAHVSEVQPMSACRIEPLRSAADNTSLVVDRASGRRGLVIWMEPPERNSLGVVVARIGYYEHGLSAAEWTCVVRRVNDEWVVNACRMTSIS